MKARKFRYVRPRSLAEAYDVLARADVEAIPIAGGQSLLAGLAMRLSAPEILVDIGDLESLRGIGETGVGIRLGALTRHAELLGSKLLRDKLPLLPMAARHIGHVAIRNRGTLGGSLAYADPAAELPACMVALDAVVVIGSASGERRVAAGDFFHGALETDLGPGELIVAVEVPTPGPGAVAGFGELSRRHGDFAIAGLAAIAIVEGAVVRSARLSYFGCVDRAAPATAVAGALEGLRLPAADPEALAAAVRRDVAPTDSPGTRADTKLHLATVVTRRVVNSFAEGRA